MIRRPLRLALFTVPLVLGLGMASGWLSGSGYGDPWFDALRKPAFMPPGWAFPVAWTTLYILIGAALARVLATSPGPARTAAIGLFVAQLVLNLAWSPVFFGAHRAEAALAVIAAMIVLAALATRAFLRVDRPAALMMLLYLAWLVFAAALNGAIVALN